LESLQKTHRGLSLGNRLKRAAALDAAKISLLRERVTQDECTIPKRLADAIKNLPLRLTAARPLNEAISSAGGLTLETLDDQLMVRALPGLFCAGEMLDWEAPTGGYLLTACLATGRAAGRGAARWIGRNAGL
jgi:predicted flavoprotein YhiN